MRIVFTRTIGSSSLLILLALGTLAAAAHAAPTDRLYLSGKGKDDAVPWDFLCAAGNHANTPSTIPVPSSWELQGFGTYNYGRDKGPHPRIEGIYSRTFTVPPTWGPLGEPPAKKVYLVFEGVQTDTQVTLNGHSAGPKHSGGFYRFQYDVTALLKPGENALRVTVDDESENASVNNAERRGDYWNFGGIYRPVYLEAVPAQSIDRVAIDAHADGMLRMSVAVSGLPAADDAPSWSIEAQVMDLQGNPVGATITEKLTRTSDTGSTQLSQKVDNPQLWTAETPALYQVELRLKNGETKVHSLRQRFGFRTIEVRPPAPGVADPGLFVNGRRVLLKGLCRHSFWPDSGRCLSETINRNDAQLLKEMNANAVRTAHYPPDQEFLDACDELGIYVLDELAGWHAHYDTPMAKRLVQEMVTRDVNHPSILFWDNGNEGGFNPEADDDFAKWDPQHRPVLHPWATFRGIDTKHYPNWNDLQQHLEGNDLYFPTEMLHGNYDGGGAAGLQDYWNLMRSSNHSAGGFIWSFLDEDVVRTDQGGKLDSRNEQAPDGVFGPYREKEGSVSAIREIWSPLVVTRTPAGTFSVENRYDFLDAATCSYTWQYRNFLGPTTQGAGYHVVAHGTGRLNGSVAPGTSSELLLDMPPDDPPAHDCLAITAKDPSGRELWTWTWLTREPWLDLLTMPAADARPIIATETPTTLTLANGAKPAASVTISKGTGEILELRGASNLFNGPRLVTGTGQLVHIDHRAEGNDHLVICQYEGEFHSLTYRLRPNGWLTIEYQYALAGPHPFFGIGFDYFSEKAVRGIRYLGQGPFRVWKNRTAGGTMNVWDKPYNDTITGDIDSLPAGEKLIYPEFKGYYADVRWLQLDTAKAPITILIHQPDTFVQFFTPQFPPTYLRGKTGVNFPSTDISFLNAIPPIGYKFVPPSILGPQGQDTRAAGSYHGAVSFFCGEFRGEP